MNLLRRRVLILFFLSSTLFQFISMGIYSGSSFALTYESIQKLTAQWENHRKNSNLPFPYSLYEFIETSKLLRAELESERDFTRVDLQIALFDAIQSIPMDEIDSKEYQSLSSFTGIQEEKVATSSVGTLDQESKSPMSIVSDQQMDLALLALRMQVKIRAANFLRVEVEETASNLSSDFLSAMKDCVERSQEALRKANAEKEEAFQSLARTKDETKASIRKNEEIIEQYSVEIARLRDNISEKRAYLRRKTLKVPESIYGGETDRTKRHRIKLNYSRQLNEARLPIVEIVQDCEKRLKQLEANRRKLYESVQVLQSISRESDLGGSRKKSKSRSKSKSKSKSASSVLVAQDRTKRWSNGIPLLHIFDQDLTHEEMKFILFSNARDFFLSPAYFSTIPDDLLAEEKELAERKLAQMEVLLDQKSDESSNSKNEFKKAKKVEFDGRIFNVSVEGLLEVKSLLSLVAELLQIETTRREMMKTLDDPYVIVFEVQDEAIGLENNSSSSDESTSGNDVLEAFPTAGAASAVSESQASSSARQPWTVEVHDRVYDSLGELRSHYPGLEIDTLITQLQLGPRLSRFQQSTYRLRNFSSLAGNKVFHCHLGTSQIVAVWKVDSTTRTVRLVYILKHPSTYKRVLKRI